MCVKVYYLDTKYAVATVETVETRILLDETGSDESQNYTGKKVQSNQQKFSSIRTNKPFSLT